MKRSLSVIFLFSCLIISFIYSINIANAVEIEFTHSIFIEHFSNIQSPLCIEERVEIERISNELGHRFHLIDFHLQDRWSTNDGSKRAAELNVSLVPSYACDGGYELRIGEVLQKDILLKAGSRVVHKIGLSIDKEIKEGELQFVCTVVERNGFPFEGEVIVYIVEDRLQSEKNEWNNVFRDYAMRERIELKPNSFEEFVNSWDIPKNANVENIRLIATVFDINEHDNSYFVQSACDEDDKINIPEFSSPYLIIIIINFITILFVKRIIKLNLNYFK
ncbi:hypothetical protein AC481_07135 [miscellaneous Crenarchaeota group archaeon SMTZ-80]|nr:MAG: hypothetical protein AC481_07135 [miscellaneous Crenarchaeota group archaeon SMTZ-80]